MILLYIFILVKNRATFATNNFDSVVIPTDKNIMCWFRLFFYYKDNYKGNKENIGKNNQKSLVKQ